MSENSFGARADLEVGGRSYEIYRLDALQEKFDVARLPFSLKILLENLLRNEDGVAVRKQDIEALATWDHNAEPSKEIAFTPARVVMQDFTGVPAVVDLAAMRDAMADLGGDPAKINPLVPAELVIDHSVQVDAFGTARRVPHQRRARVRAQPGALRVPALGPDGVRGLRRRPARHRHRAPGQPRVPRARRVRERGRRSYPDTLVGTDSHTTMINGLGVLGWGVGGIEAEAAMLGQAMSMLIPRVVGFKLGGELPEGATATDLVLTVTQMLREHGVVGKFVEFYGPGIPNLPLADRATIGNMSPEFGSTCAIFPIDAETLRYMEFTGRSKEQIEIVEAYAKAQGLWHDAGLRGADVLRDARARPRRRRAVAGGPEAPAGPRRADRVQGRVPRRARGRSCPTRSPSPRTSRGTDVDEEVDESFPASDPPGAQRQRLRPRHRAAAGGTAPACRSPSASSTTSTLTLDDGTETELDHGHVVIAAITSLHQHVEPVGDDRRRPAGQERGRAGPAVQAVGEDLARAGLEGRHGVLRQGGPGRLARGARLPPRRLRLHDVHRQLRPAAGRGLERRQRRGPRGRVACCRGNRNFEGRINPDVKMNYLASPPLVVAYALAGTMDIDLLDEPLGQDDERRRRLPQGHLALRRGGRRASSRSPCTRRCSSPPTARSSRATSAGRALEIPEGDRFAWDERSTYVRRPDVPGGRPEGAGRARGHRGRARAGQARRLGHHRPHLAGRRDQEGHARRRCTSTSTASSRRTSTPTARAAATTR